MRILHVVYDCNPLQHRGGISKIVLELSRAQATEGHAVTIVTLGIDDLPAREMVESVTIERYSATPLLGRAHSFSLAMGARRLPRFDVIHAHNTFLPLNATARRLAAVHDAALFITPHGALDPQLLRGRTLRALKKRCYIWAVERRNLNSATGVIVNTSDEVAWLRELGVVSPLHVVPNGAALLARSAGRAVDGDSSVLARDPAILFVGRIVRKKRVLEIVQALSEVQAVHPLARLLIAGDRRADPDYVVEIDAEIERRGLGGSVMWLGFLDEGEKLSAYRDATVFVHASISEGMPMAVLEAMGAGIPCVVTPGTKMTAVADAGGLVEVEMEHLGRALSELLGDELERRRLSERSVELVQSQYSWPAVAKRVLGHYEASAAPRAR